MKDAPNTAQKLFSDWHEPLLASGRLRRYGEAKIPHPFHSVDCGLCMMLACFTERLDYKSFFPLEFSKLHDGLKLMLTVSGPKSASSKAKTDLTSFHYREDSNHSYWVVRSSPGLTGNVDWDKIVSAEIVDAPPSPGYSVVSPVPECIEDTTPKTTPVRRSDMLEALLNAPIKRGLKRQVLPAPKTSSLGTVSIKSAPGLYDSESD